MSPSFDQVTVVIVTYNSAHCIGALVPLLAECPHVIVSDNGSSDDTLSCVAQHVPHAHRLSHGRNLGFGAANNRALERVDTPFALLLNPDCTLDPAHLKQLLLTAQQYPDAAIVAPQLLDGRGEPDVNYRFPHGWWPPRDSIAEAPACVGFVCGAAMLFRLDAFNATGFFDEDFFLYYEDDDLCLRLFQRHLPIVLDPMAVAFHRSRGSVKGGQPWRSEYGRGYHHAQSKLTFMAKHRSLDKARSVRQRLLWQTALVLPLRVLAFSPKLIARMWGRLAGLYDWQR